MGEKLKLPMMVKYNELQLGDHIEFFEGAYGTGTVYETNEAGDVLVWRPYIVTSDFSTSGATERSLRAAPSIGIEQITLFSGGNKTIKLLRRGSPKK